MSTPPTPAPDAPPVPAPLTVALSLVAIEGLLFALYGVSQLFALDLDRPEVALGNVAFFVAYGVFLGYAAVQVYRLHSWARAPIVLGQLLQIAVGVDFWGGGTTAVAVVLVGVAVLVLVGVLHPASLAYLAADED